LLQVFWGPLFFFTCVSFLWYRPKTLLSAQSKSLERYRRSTWLPWKWQRTLVLPFDEIREFVVEAEFEFAPEKPFIWHLLTVDRSGRRHALTWHFEREPVRKAGKAAASVSGKPLREIDDPIQTGRWEPWSYNFFR